VQVAFEPRDEVWFPLFEPVADAADLAADGQPDR
jgi:hypothetical protein